jgi:hypothetical protein
MKKKKGSRAKKKEEEENVKRGNDEPKLWSAEKTIKIQNEYPRNILLAAEGSENLDKKTWDKIMEKRRNEEKNRKPVKRRK